MKLIVDSCVFIDSFDPQSSNHVESVRLLEELLHRGIPITMPAHGWFEVQCTLQRFIKEKRFVPPTIGGRQHFPIRLIHIDQSFIEKYKMVDIPYIKAGDHIFIAVAKLNDCPLVTNDATMAAVSKQCSVRVFTPTEFINELATNA